MRFRSVLFVIIAMLIITSPLLSFAESLRVKDGDTIKLDGLNIRLLDVDAPESDQKCLDKKEKEWALCRPAFCKDLLEDFLVFIIF